MAMLEILLLKSGHLVDHGTVEALCGKYGGAKGLEEIYMQVFGEEEKDVSADRL